MGAWEEGVWLLPGAEMQIVPPLRGETGWAWQWGGVLLGIPGRASATVPHQLLAEDHQLWTHQVGDGPVGTLRLEHMGSTWA